MLESRLSDVLADVLKVDRARITHRVSRDNTPEWDSLKHIALVMALEEEFEIALDVDEIEAMTSYADVLRIIRGKSPE